MPHGPAKPPARPENELSLQPSHRTNALMPVDIHSYIRALAVRRGIPREHSDLHGAEQASKRSRGPKRK